MYICICIYIYMNRALCFSTPAQVQPIPIEMTFFKAQSSKLVGLFSLVCRKRDPRALRFELWKMSFQMGWAVYQAELAAYVRHRILVMLAYKYEYITHRCTIYGSPVKGVRMNTLHTYEYITHVWIHYKRMNTLHTYEYITNLGYACMHVWIHHTSMYHILFSSKECAWLPRTHILQTYV